MLQLFLLIAAAATPSAIAPRLGGPIGDMPNWFNDSDWTSSRAGGAVRFKVGFNQAGTPDTCVIEATTGNKEVEALACKVVMKRFRFKPSFDTEGAPVSRVFIRSISMAQQIPEAIRPPAQFSLSIVGYKEISRISVVVDVKQDGTLAGCVGTEKKKNLIELAAATCQNLKSLWEPLPEIDNAGNAIRYVRDVAVEIKHTPDSASPANDR